MQDSGDRILAPISVDFSVRRELPLGLTAKTTGADAAD
jgi:hypothetical protein